MILEIKIPSPGESITEVEIGKWLVEDGSMVEKNQEVAEVESDKATFTLSASATGRIRILLKEGERVSIGSTACTIDDSGISEMDKTKEGESGEKVEESKSENEKPVELKSSSQKKADLKEKDVSTQNIKASGESSTELRNDPEPEGKLDIVQQENPVAEDSSKIKFTAAARAVMDAEELSVDEVLEGIHRLTRQDVESAVKALKNTASEQQDYRKEKETQFRSEERSPMSPLRRKLSQRLVAVKNETAMLTTFNEIDMQQLIQLRTEYQKAFTAKYGIKLGYMSFFTKAVSIALELYPNVNSMIDGEDILTPNYQDIGIAVQTEKGLMVPVIRNAGSKSIPELEKEIMELAEKARNKKLSIQEMTGGTFTITNGGLFGSLLSTPIINPPQSAILGMHTIKERPVAINKQVEIRPMMYAALTYDHRLIDGKDSVSFLVKVKELIENPVSLLYRGKNLPDLLLGLDNI